MKLSSVNGKMETKLKAQRNSQMLLFILDSIKTEQGMAIVSKSSQTENFIKGSFKYEDNGIFDYTHVRFYCKKDMIELANKANLNVLKSEGSISNYKGKSLVKYINKLTFGFFEEFFCKMY